VNAEAAASGTRGDKRRRQILRALHDCILEQGYAKTTLADVAERAGMSASHLLYYFNGKDAILEQYFQDVADRILARLEELRDEAPQRQIELLADFFFSARGITKSEIGFMLECFGVAVNDKELQREKAELDRRCKVYLTDLFRRLPRRAEAGARESAEVAYAVLIGLRTAVFFDDDIDLPAARRLFYASMIDLAGLDADG